MSPDPLLVDGVCGRDYWSSGIGAEDQSAVFRHTHTDCLLLQLHRKLQGLNQL